MLISRVKAGCRGGPNRMSLESVPAPRGFPSPTPPHVGFRAQTGIPTRGIVITELDSQRGQISNDAPTPGIQGAKSSGKSQTGQWYSLIRPMIAERKGGVASRRLGASHRGDASV